VRSADSVPETASRSHVAKLQAYVTSLLYLRQEAQRDGLEPIAAILWNALAAVEAWLETPESPIASHELIDSSFCHSLDFLLKWTMLPAAKQRALAGLLADHEGAPSDMNGNARPRARLSKTTTK
jgi:hypothetical protein